MNRSRQSYRARDICAVRGTLSTIWEHLRRVCFESDCATLHWFRWITSLDEKLVKTRDSGEEKVCCCCHAAAAGDDTICEAHLHLFFVMPSSSISFSFELSMLASIAWASSMIIDICAEINYLSTAAIDSGGRTTTKRREKFYQK